MMNLKGQLMQLFQSTYTKIEDDALSVANPTATTATTDTFSTSGQPNIAPPMTRKTGQGGKRLKLHTRCAKSKPKGLLRISRKKK